MCYTKKECPHFDANKPEVCETCLWKSEFIQEIAKHNSTKESRNKWRIVGVIVFCIFIITTLLLY